MTYFHVALEQHDIVMADGMAAESEPVDSSSRERGEFGCLPYALGAGAIPVHARLLQRAHDLGHSLTQDPALCLSVNGARLEPSAQCNGELTYVLPPGTLSVRLTSRVQVPCDLDPAGGDTRRLDVALASLRLDGAEKLHDGAIFGPGVLVCEGTDSNAWRWTDGAGELRLTPAEGEVTLALRIHLDWGRYWLLSPMASELRETMPAGKRQGP